MATDITAIITGHREGHVSVASLRSFQIAIEQARSAGLTCQAIYVLDRPDELTRSLFERYASGSGDFMVVDFGDQGFARNAAIERAEGLHTAFLDGDDLWARNWLVSGLDFLKLCPPNHIAHPQYNYFFEGQATIFTHIDQLSNLFNPDLLRITNYWDSLCICPTRIHREFPFCKRDIQAGFAYEDWHWNCETVAAGKVHRVVPETVIFKRRQKTSQTIAASQRKSLMRVHALNDYAHPLYGTAPDVRSGG